MIFRAYTFITKLIFLFAIIQSCSISVLNAQVIPFKTISLDEGLSQSVVQAITQDKFGYLWIGTEYGLNRFNGKRVDAFYQTNGLPSNNITEVYYDNAGVLWVGTDHGVATYLNEQFNIFEGTDTLIQNPINKIIHHPDGSVWIATEGSGVWHYDGLVFERWNTDNGLPSDSVRDIYFDNDRIIWMATRNGVAYFDGTAIRVVNKDEGLSDEKVRSLTPLSNLSLIAGTRNGITLLFKSGDSEHIAVNMRNQLLKVNQVMLDSRSRMWIAEESGLWRIDDINKPALELIYNETFVSSVFEDASGSIWFGTFGNGALQYQGDAFINYTTDSGLPNAVVSSVYQTKDKVTWVGTFGGGVLRMAPNGEKQVFQRSNSSLKDNRIFHIIEDESNRIWFATRNGINRYKEGIGLQQIPRIPNDKYRFIHQVSHDLFWLASEENGIFLWNDRKQTIEREITTKEGLISNSVRVVEASSDGRLWVGTTNGISMIDGKTVTNYNLATGLINQVILDIFEGWDGRIWFAHFMGLSSLNKDGTWSHYPLEFKGEPLAAYVVREFDDYLWVGTNKGLVRFNHKQKNPQIKFYTADMGLVSDELNKGSIFIDTEGYFWLGTIRGLSKFDPLLQYEKKIQATVLIDEIEAQGKRNEAYENIELEYDDNHFEIHFSAITTQDPSTIQFRYRLRDADPDWQTTYSNSVRYAGLPDGDYQFQLQSISNDGIQSQSVYANVKVLPPFWRASWFIFLVLSSLFVLAYLIVNNIRVSKQVEVERMRVRIAGDLHDDVGASLTEMALQADFIQSYPLSDEIKETMQQLGDMSRQVVNTMDDIVWSIDARNDTVGDLTDRIQDFANQILSRTAIQIYYHFDLRDEKRTIHADTRQNVYLICKEAVNNAVKYSEATEIHLSLRHDKNACILEIKDNGKGLPESGKKTGHGLKNMQLRAKRLQANLEFISDKGLTVRLTNLKL